MLKFNEWINFFQNPNSKGHQSINWLVFNPFVYGLNSNEIQKLD